MLYGEVVVLLFDDRNIVWQLTQSNFGRCFERCTVGGLNDGVFFTTVEQLDSANVKSGSNIVTIVSFAKPSGRLWNIFNNLLGNSCNKKNNSKSLQLYLFPCILVSILQIKRL